MLILHFSLTPLVGAPGRICHALNKLPDCESRWIVFDRSSGNYSVMDFELDLFWECDKAEILGLVARCDVIHLHNYIGLDSEEFHPINFRQLWEQDKCIIRQFHSSPEFIAAQLNISTADVLNCPLPHLVIAQFQERYYQNARIVPNIIVSPAPKAAAMGKAIRVGFAPTRFNSAKNSRWDTKGYPETIRLLRALEQRTRRLGIAVEIDVIELVSHTECMSRKAACDIFIDDLVTGSYHLNTLEALAQGVVCLCFLDHRTQQVIQNLTNRNDIPVLNVGIENALEVLVELCQKPDLVRELGAHCRTWMESHWEASKLAQHFVKAYEYSIARPHEKYPEENCESLANAWLNIGFNDAIWRSRQQFWPSVTPVWLLDIRRKLASILLPHRST